MMKNNQIIFHLKITLISILLILSGVSSAAAVEDGDCTWWSDIQTLNSFTWQILAYEMGDSSLEALFDLGDIKPQADQKIVIQLNDTPPANYRFHLEQRDERHDPWFLTTIAGNVSENKNKDPFPFILPEKIVDVTILKLGVHFIPFALHSLIKYDGGEAWINGTADNPLPPTIQDNLVNLTFIYQGLKGEILWEVTTGLLKFAKLDGTETHVKVELLTDPLNPSTSTTTTSATQKTSISSSWFQSSSEHTGFIFGFEAIISLTSFLCFLWIRRYFHNRIQSSQ